MMDNIRGNDVQSRKDKFNNFKEQAYELFREFEELRKENENISSMDLSNLKSDEATNIDVIKVNIKTQHFIRSCINNLSRSCSMLPKIVEYERHFSNSNNFEKSYEEMFWFLIQESIDRTSKYKKAVIWNAGYLNFDLYIWETALLIETDAKASFIICKYLKEQFRSSNNSFYDRFINNYTSAFPGLLKSICDMSPEESITNKPAKTSVVAQRFTNQDCEVEDLMDLYYSIGQNKKTKKRNSLPSRCKAGCKVAFNDYFIYEQLREEKIRNFENLQ